MLTRIFLAVTAYGGWLTGDWIAGEVPQEAAHPGYFLPTVAGGLIGAGAAAVFRMHTLYAGSCCPPLPLSRPARPVVSRGADREEHAPWLIGPCCW